MNIAGYSPIPGQLHYAHCREAINIAASENEILRLILQENDNIPTQTIASEICYRVPLVDLSNTANPQESAYEWMIHSTNVAFMPQNLLMDFALLKISDTTHYLFSKYHHLTTDSWGIALLLQRVTHIYNCLVKGQQITNASTSCFLEQILKETHYLESEKFKQDLHYWQTKLTPAYTPLFAGKTLASGKCQRQTLILGKEDYMLLEQRAKQLEVSLFQVLLAAILTYFGTLYKRNELIVGINLLNRPDFQAKNTIGLFTNTVPFRFHLDPEQNIPTILEKMKSSLLQDYRHQRCPRSLIYKDQHHLENGINDLLVSFEKHDYTVAFNGENSKALFLPNKIASNALAIYIWEYHQAQELYINLDFSQDIFSQQNIHNIFQEMHRHLQNFSQSKLESSNNFGDISKLTPENTRASNGQYSLTKPTIDNLISHIAHTTPDKIALVCGHENQTYQELETQASQIASKLVNQYHVKPDDIIAVQTGRCLALLASMLGILKAGGAILLLDDKLPEKRVQYMLETCRAKLILQSTKHIAPFSHQQKVVYVEDLLSSPASNFVPEHRGHNLAYIMFTSGSTGEPKGVMIEHANLSGFLHSICKQIPLNSSSKICAITNLSFDIFILESLVVLAQGGSIYLTKEEDQEHPAQITRLMDEQRLTTLQTTPTRLRLFMESCENYSWLENLEVLLLGGEVLSENLLNDIRRYYKKPLYHVYGPTETTIWATLQIIGASTRINLGYPLDNTEIYIMDEFGNVLPADVEGEICIAGSNLARGYLHDEALTHSKFIFNSQLNRRLYKTGDRGKKQTDNALVFLGRKDNQLKIHGARIEAGEIEAKLNQFPGVKDCVVVAKDGTHLCVYFTAENQLSSENITKYLAKELPPHMVPHLYIQLESFPLTLTGKKDRTLLASYQFPSTTNPIEAGTNLEKTLLSAWQKAFGKDNISIDDDFFALGGDSLAAVIIITQLEKNNLACNLAEIYYYKTIRKLAHYIEKTKLESL